MVIKINKKLDYFSSFDPTKESKPISLGNLCKDIEEGRLTLPIFQTGIRWKVEKSIELLNFQLTGKAAVAPISINVIENKNIAVPQVKFISRDLVPEEELSGKHSVNDGQQRLSCNYKAYTDDEEFRNVVLDITTGKFLLNSGTMRKSQIPVGKLYNKDPKVFEEFVRNNPEMQVFEVQSLLTRIRNKFLAYYYTVNYAKDLSEEEQREWFEVLNLAGSKVTETEVHLTEMLVKGVDYYRDYAEKFGDKLKESGLDGLFVQKATEISVPLAALNPAYEIIKQKPHSANFSPMPSDVKASLISKLKAEELRTIFSWTLEALDKALVFIESKGLFEPKRIDYLTYLLGAFVVLGNAELNPAQEDFLVDWYENVEFAKKDNGVRRKIFDDLIAVVKL
ncbi:GmrSD restriction endonuclease domain-containing protein [Bacillus subtilis]|uniref:GmrSD restriction endonuclease domain-containing protein n=1 Tax=Bacillus subtilis TaxID=1423 RepID=UPI003F76853D